VDIPYQMIFVLLCPFGCLQTSCGRPTSVSFYLILPLRFLLVVILIVICSYSVVTKFVYSALESVSGPLKFVGTSIFSNHFYAWICDHTYSNCVLIIEYGSGWETDRKV